MVAKRTTHGVVDILSSPWAKIIAAATLVGLGYKVGEFKEQNRNNIMIMEMKQDCQERMHKIMDEFRACQINEQNQRILELTKLHQTNVEIGKAIKQQ